MCVCCVVCMNILCVPFVYEVYVRVCMAYVVCLCEVDGVCVVCLSVSVYVLECM